MSLLKTPKKKAHIYEARDWSRKGPIQKRDLPKYPKEKTTRILKKPNNSSKTLASERPGRRKSSVQKETYQETEKRSTDDTKETH